MSVCPTKPPENSDKSLAELQLQTWFTFIKATEKYRDNLDRNRECRFNDNKIRWILPDYNDNRPLDKHYDIQCHKCGYLLANGLRWKCKRCINHNLCDTCYVQLPLNAKHPYELIPDSQRILTT